MSKRRRLRRWRLYAWRVRSRAPGERGLMMRTVARNSREDVLPLYQVHCTSERLRSTSALCCIRTRQSLRRSVVTPAGISPTAAAERSLQDVAHRSLHHTHIHTRHPASDSGHPTTDCPSWMARRTSPRHPHPRTASTLAEPARAAPRPCLLLTTYLATAALASPTAPLTHPHLGQCNAASDSHSLCFTTAALVSPVRRHETTPSWTVT